MNYFKKKERNKMISESKLTSFVLPGNIREALRTMAFERKLTMKALLIEILTDYFIKEGKF